MSLESALDEERREILKLLESPPHQRRPSRSSGSLGSALAQDASRRPHSPLGPRSPVRSMLDVESTPKPVRSMLDVGDDPPATRHASIAGTSVGVTPPSGQSGSRGVQSLLDTSVSPPPSRHHHSANTSPIDAPSESARVHRTASDAAAHPPPRVPRLHRERDRSSMASLEADYQFAVTPSAQGISLPKRGAQSGTRPTKFSKSMARVMQAMDLGEPGPRRGTERGRHTTVERGSLVGGSGSRSPSASFGRAQSPHTGKLNTNTMNMMLGPGKLVSDSGELMDMNNAYRRLSDANLARSGGSLSHLAARPGSEGARSDKDDTSPSGDVRLQKDYGYGGDEAEAEEEAVLDSSDEDSDMPSPGDWDDDNRRGRIRDRNKTAGAGDGPAADMTYDGAPGVDPGPTTNLGMGQGKGPRKTLSLLAAAEEERQQVSSQYKVQSLLGPPVTVTTPSGERLSPKKAGVHPTTSFDQGTSTPVTSDTEADMSDIRRAQRMSVSISPVTSTPESHRSIRTIVRGEFAQMQHEAEEGTRRVRKYLVATDLSDEAAYALEWTIGTILRDGDTLIAVYALEDESRGSSGAGASAAEADASGTQAVGIGEGALMMRDHAALIGLLTTTRPQPSTATATTTTSTTGPGLSPLSAMTPGGGGAAATTASSSPDSRNMSRAEQERMRATEDISQRCVKLLRKTRLQVRVVIEVIHCKSPKHLITEVIDFMAPTLVILGSRGRSALKGVLLGSFSNYLVTKSSVPVMVARKRLRKHARPKKSSPLGAFNGNNVRQPNNLTAFAPGSSFNKSLATAKID